MSDTEFKVGDKVIRTVAGVVTEGVITSFFGPFVRINGDRHGHDRGCFKLIEPPVKTDAELADEYRKLFTEMRGIRLELEERGFTIHTDGVPIHKMADPNYTFVKEVLTKIEL